MRSIRQAMNSKQKKPTTSYEILSNTFTPEKALGTRPNIVCKEEGVQYRLVGIDQYSSALFSVDGGIIPSTLSDIKKCDKLILLYDQTHLQRGGGLQLFIELKGSDIEKGIKQIEETLKHPVFTALPKGEKREVRLVVGKVPAYANSPAVEKLRTAFSKRQNCLLKIVRSQAPDKVKLT